MYSFARKDGTLFSGNDESQEEIFQKLYDWILTTDDFNLPKLDKEGNRITSDKGYSTVLSTRNSKKNFLPLLTLTCSKIIGCKMGLKQNPKAPEIWKRFKDFGNFEILRFKYREEGLVDLELINDLSQEVAKEELKMFIIELDELLEAFPQHKEIEIMKHELKTPNPIHSTNNELQRKFDDIGNKFLAPESSETEEQMEIHFKNFIDSIEATDNLIKKSIMKTLLIRFIFKIYKQNKLKSRPMIKKTLAYLIDRTRHSFSLKHIDAFQNFLIFTLDATLSEAKYNPVSPNEAFFHDLDVIFFIQMTNIDKSKAFAENKDAFPGSIKQLMNEQTVRTNAILLNLFYKKGNFIKENRKKLKKFTIANDPNYD